jgi:hypothetical protein
MDIDHRPGPVVRGRWREPNMTAHAVASGYADASFVNRIPLSIKGGKHLSRGFR